MNEGIVRMTQPKTLKDVIDAMTVDEYKEWITKLSKVLCANLPEVIYETEDLDDVKVNYEIVTNRYDLTSSGTGQFTGGYYEEEYAGVDVTYVFGFDNGLYSYKVIRNKPNDSISDNNH